MSVKPTPEGASFGLLPEPERSTGSLLTSAIVNGGIVLLLLWVGQTAHKVMEEHRYEQTTLIMPEKEPPPPPKVKLPPPPKMTELPPPPIEQPKIVYQREEVKPEPKPIVAEQKVNLPEVKSNAQKVTLAPQPKAALAAAMPAQSNAMKASTAPVHLGQTFGVMPNANATRPANVAAIGNMYGNSQGAVGAPHGVVGSTGIGNGLKSGSNAGQMGHGASAGIPHGATGTSQVTGHVASAGIPAMTVAHATPMQTASVSATSVEVLSRQAPQYTAEARQMKVQGEVVLRVTFTAQGRVQVQGVVHGLGHGLDEEARRVAQSIRFRPATRNGQPIDTTTNITISFQLA